MKRYSPLLSIVCILLTNAAIPTGQADAVTIGLDVNLISNPGAELGSPLNDGYTHLDDWTITSGPTDVNGFFGVPWGQPSGFPLLTDPGPEPASARGTYFFAGGANNSYSSAGQLVTGTTAEIQAAIDGGTVPFDLSGWLGGYSAFGDYQEDNAVLEIRFLDAANEDIGTTAIGPVTNDDRGSLTGLLLRQETGFVPSGTRSISVELQMTRLNGTYNDGYADNLSLVFHAPLPPAPFNIFQWKYVDPQDPSQGKLESSIFTKDGYGLHAAPGLEASGKNLTKAFLIGVDLTNAVLSGTNLTNADLSQANLTSANLNGAYLANANFSQANLTGAKIGATATRANFSEANFTAADLRGANLTGANLYQAILTGAKVTGGIFASSGITPDQLYSTADYQAHDLTGIGLAGNDLSGANFVGQRLAFANLSSANLTGANLTNTNLVGATVSNANFSQANFANANFNSAKATRANFSQANLTAADLRSANLNGANLIGAILTDAQVTNANLSSTHITLAQLYSTANYVAHDLTGIGLVGSDLTGANFGGQRLANANLYATKLTGADLSNADLTGATLTNADIRQANLANANFVNAALVNVNLEQANLTNTDFTGANLAGAYLNGADVRGARLAGVVDYTYGCIRIQWGGCRGYGYTPDGISGGINLAQLSTTLSYQAHDLSGIDLSNTTLVGASFAGYNLTNAKFTGAVLTRATLGQADLSGADARGATGLNWTGAVVANLIRPDGHVNGLDLGAGQSLSVRDYDGNPAAALAPIAVTIDQHFAMGPGGALRMVFDADAWDSTISFAAGIPVTLGGNLELTFATDVNLVSQIGRTFDVFDWTGVSPTGTFAVSSPYVWDLSNLYTTGEITFVAASPAQAIPEPTSLFLLSIGLVAVIAARPARLTRRVGMLHKPVRTVLVIVAMLVVSSGRVRADAPEVGLTKIGNPTWKPADFQLFTAPAAPFPNEFNHVFDTLAPLDGPSVGMYAPHAPPYDTELSTAAAAAGYVNQSVFTPNAITLHPNGVYFAFTLLPNPGITGSSRDFASGPVIPNSVYPLSSNVDVWLDGVLVDRLLGSDFNVSVSSSDEPFQGTSHLPAIQAIWHPWDDDLAVGPLGSYELRWSLHDASGSGWDIVAPFQVVPAIAGDYDGNGTVDAADYTIWQDTLGSTTDLRANGDNTGASANVIDQADFIFWKARFGVPPGSGAGGGANAAAPEPASLVMLLIGMLALFSRRRTTAS